MARCGGKSGCFATSQTENLIELVKSLLFSTFYIVGKHKRSSACHRVLCSQLEETPSMATKSRVGERLVDVENVTRSLIGSPAGKGNAVTTWLLPLALRSIRAEKMRERNNGVLTIRNVLKPRSGFHACRAMAPGTDADRHTLRHCDRHTLRHHEALANKLCRYKDFSPETMSPCSRPSCSPPPMEESWMVAPAVK